METTIHEGLIKEIVGKLVQLSEENHWTNGEAREAVNVVYAFIKNSILTEEVQYDTSAVRDIVSQNADTLAEELNFQNLDVAVSTERAVAVLSVLHEQHCMISDARIALVQAKDYFKNRVRI